MDGARPGAPGVGPDRGRLVLAGRACDRAVAGRARARDGGADEPAGDRGRQLAVALPRPRSHRTQRRRAPGADAPQSARLVPGEGLEPPRPYRTAGFKPAASDQFRHPGTGARRETYGGKCASAVAGSQTTAAEAGLCPARGEEPSHGRRSRKGGFGRETRVSLPTYYCLVVARSWGRSATRGRGSGRPTGTP